jgi:lipoate-protein ligase B
MTEMTWLVDLGTMEYGKAWELQKALVQRRISGEIPDVLLLVEHPEVITLGVRGKQDDVFTSEVPVFKIERGGEATYHGPGQLVGYPIFSLKEWPGVMDFVRKLEEVIIRASRDLGAEAGRSAQTGVWVGQRKLASIGLAVKNRVTYHGFAVNVSTDLSRFMLLKPCGMEGSMMTSLSVSTGREVGLREFREKLLARFEELFETKLEQKEVSSTS